MTNFKDIFKALCGWAWAKKLKIFTGLMVVAFISSLMANLFLYKRTIRFANQINWQTENSATIEKSYKDYSADFETMRQLALKLMEASEKRSELIAGLDLIIQNYCYITDTGPAAVQYGRMQALYAEVERDYAKMNDFISNNPLKTNEEQTRGL